MSNTLQGPSPNSTVEGCYACHLNAQSCGSWEHLIDAVALRIHHSLNLANILQTTVDEVHQFLDCDRVLIYRFEPDWSGQVVVEAVSTPQWSVVNRVIHDPCFTSSWLEPYQRNRYFAVEDVTAANLTPCHAEFLAKFQVRANLVIPILEGETLWGLLIAHHCQAPRPWQSVEIKGLQRLMVQVGIAIHQASLIEQLQVAKTTLESKVAARTRQLEAANQALEETNQSLIEKILECNQVAAEVITQEEFLQHVLDSLFTFVGVLTPDGILLEANQAPIEIAGLTRAEVIGQSFADAYWWAYSSDTQATIRQAIKTASQGQAVRFDIALQIQDGQQIIIDFSLTPLRDPKTGAITHLIPSGVDISDRIKAEAERTRLLSVLEASVNEIYLFHANTLRLQYANQGALHNLGFSLEQLQQMTILDIKPALSLPEFEVLVAPLRNQTVNKITFETVYLRANGSCYPVEVHLQLTHQEGDPFFLGVILDITHRKQVEAERLRDQAQLQQLGTIVASSQDAIISKTPDGLVTSWNRAAETLFGYSAQEIIGQPISTIIPDQLRQEATQILERIQQGQPVDTYETQRRHKNGQMVEVSLTISPIYNEAGEIVGASKIARDITAQKQAEFLMRDQAETLRIFYETSPLMMGLVEISDHDVLHLSDNPAALGFFGVSAADLTNHWASDVGVPPEVIQLWLTHYRQSQQQGSPVQFDYNHETMAGRYWLLVTVSFVGTGESGHSRFSYIVQDLTEKKHLEHEKDRAVTGLLDSEQRYASLIAAVPVGIFRTDVTGQCIYVNERWAQIAGMGPEQAKGDGWVQAIYSDDREQVFAVWTTAAQTQQQFELEYRFQSTTGEVTWVYGQAVAEYTAAGEFLGYVGTITDISDRKQIEAERRRAEQVQMELNLLEKILEVVLAGYWDWHLASNEEYLSPGFKRMFGYEDHELSNRAETWQNLIFPEDLPQVLAQFDRHIQSHGVEPYYNEARYRHKNGSTVWVICSGQVIEWDDDGTPLRMIGCHIDITQRKQAEADLRQSEATKHALIQAIPDFLVRMRQDGIQLEVINTGSVHCLSSNAGPIEGYSILNIMPRGIAQERIQLAQKAIATGESQRQEYVFIERGQTYYEEARITPIWKDEVLVMVRDISDRKQAELAVKSTKEQLELVLKASSEGFWDWDLLTNEIYFSPRWKEMLGYANHELENTLTMWESVIFDADWADALRLIEKYNSGKADNFTAIQRFHHKNGSTVFILSRAIHLKNAEGEVIRMVGSHLDITANKRQELELQESEARYRHIIETTLEGVWMLDTEGKTSFVNQRMADMLGYDIAAIQNQSLLDFMAIDGQAKAKDYLARRQQGINEQHPFKFCRQDGTALWTMVSATPLMDKQGNYQGVIGLLTNITELVETQEALKTSELQLSGILNSSLDGIMAFRAMRDAMGTIVDFEWVLSNPTACEMVDKPKEALIGQRLLTEFPGHYDEGLFDLYVQVVESGEPARQQFHYNHDGIDRWFENIVVKLGDGFVVTFRDITQTKQSEQKIQQVNQQLEIHLDDLKQRNSEMLMLSRTSDFLQACRSIPEACTVISTLVRPLFPTCSGSIYITNDSRHRLERVAAWGEQSSDQVDFAPHDCWGLRRGRLHLVKPEISGLRCLHNGEVANAAETLCIPMIAQGETLGLFYLQTEDRMVLSETQQQLAQTVAEQIGLAIANLHLRETLQHQSIRDGLTGLFNRRYLEEGLQQEIARAQHNQYEIGVIMLDVDHFKRFNDTHGHEAGDLVLQALGKLLRHQVRGSDLACRYGGEELTLIFPESSLQATENRANEIRVAISQLQISFHGTLLGKLTASLGVAAFPKHGMSGAALLQAADAALYRAKKAGRNQVVVAP